MASFLPHFLSLDCCLATFSQKFCLLSGRVKRHSLHSLLSHLAHTVASTVELFNSTGFLAHIMMFIFNFHFQIIIFHFASLEYPLTERTPHSSLSAPSSTRLVGTPPTLCTCPPQPHPSLPGPACLPCPFAVGERCGVFGSAKLAPGAQLRGWSLASAHTTPGSVGVCEQGEQGRACGFCHPHPSWPCQPVGEGLLL